MKYFVNILKKYTFNFLFHVVYACDQSTLYQEGPMNIYKL